MFWGTYMNLTRFIVAKLPLVVAAATSQFPVIHMLYLYRRYVKIKAYTRRSNC